MKNCMKICKFLLKTAIIIAGVYVILRVLQAKQCCKNAASVGIIGSSDGPTKIFITRKNKIFN